MIGVTSPPYFEQLGKGIDDPKYERRGAWIARNDYGSTDGQIGNLKD